jgi:prepilin-type processing-associated H-X9-DG protein
LIGNQADEEMEAEQNKQRGFPSEAPGTMDRSAFTLVELLALVIMLGFISVLVVPAMVRGRQKTIETVCQSNLKAIGLAIQAYSEDNRYILPGPVFPLARPGLDRHPTNQLAWFLANRLGSSATIARTNVVLQFLCPAHPSASSGNKVVADYGLNEGKGLPGPPFGCPSPARAPLSLTSLAASASPAACLAVTDADKGNVNPTADGWSSLPYQPVHGRMRNQLFFDWHVAGKTW